MMDRYVVNSHGDRFRPLTIRLWDPFRIAYMVHDMKPKSGKFGEKMLLLDFSGGGDFFRFYVNFLGSTSTRTQRPTLEIRNLTTGIEKL